MGWHSQGQAGVQGELDRVTFCFNCRQLRARYTLSVGSKPVKKPKSAFTDSILLPGSGNRKNKTGS